MKKTILLILSFSIFLIGQAQDIKTIDIQTPGSLSSSLSSSEKQFLSNLTVTGYIDARDFVCLRDEMKNLSVLDISGAAVVSYNGNEGTDAQTINYAENALPAYSFYDWKLKKSNNILKSVKLSSTLVSIEDFAFFYCTVLNDIQLPGTLISIKEHVFEGCISLGSINIPNSVTELGEFSFGSCYSLTSVTLPMSLNTLAEKVFEDCTGLKNIVVPTENLFFLSADGVLFNKGQSVLIRYPQGKTGMYSISETVIKIGNYAFSHCSGLTGINIPESVTSIGEYAFIFCEGLSALSIPNSVKSIGEGAFSACSGLITLLIGNSVDSIQTHVFSSCSGLNEIILPNSVKYIGENAFSYCSSLQKLTISASVKAIEDHAFAYCSNLNTVKAYPVIPVNLFQKYYVFYYVDKNTCILHIPIGTLSAYQTADEWKYFKIIQEDLSTSIAETFEESNISFYPNPVTDHLHIKGLTGRAQICIYNISGEILLAKDIAENEDIYLQHFLKGLYLMKISIAGESCSKMFVKN